MAEERPQRRLVAIMAADVVGYSRLMEQDEAGTLAVLKSRRKSVLEPLVVKHRGRIFKVAGDGVLVEFASAVNAVHCAIELQRGMADANGDGSGAREILLRVGVNLGDVVVEGSDLYGEGVNIAARLEAIADPGCILLSGTAYDHVRNKIQAAFDDLGPQALKNISEPVRAYRVGPAAASVPPPMPGVVSNRPSIAVLPFTNMSGDAEQEYFSDGITEDIITELSRFHGLVVIARNSTFTYKGKPTKVGTIARELGVDYVLEGSVRRAGNRVRITAQLVEGASGNHVWADRYDREMADIFAVQDEVTLSIVGALTVQLEDEVLQRAKRKRPESLLAYEHYLRGKRSIWTTGESNLEARRHFERAIAIDPAYSAAHSGLAITYQMEAVEFPLPADFRAIYDKAYGSAQAAVALDGADCQAHTAMAWQCLYRREYDRVKRHVERAIALNPNDANMLAQASYMLSMLGDAEAGVRCGEAAVRLNPRHLDWYLAYYATALFTARRYEESMTIRLRAPPFYIDSSFIGAATLAQMGRLDEARQWADRGVGRLATTPGGALAIAEGKVVGALLDNNPYRHQADSDHLAEGMRKAGVPG